ncbi:hypothetical protein [Nocardiopsis composta]|uniref:Uncharacterized protein n=1 Tax=Nocardiopsis composta TaxID=157465 RepID=A0A7W8QTE1_9ACTN|nr:hypothetical protein [Nocardiopsis composta]MBB5435630.1 hypothetical protein [Nocardiopsis composta]
MSTPPHPPQDPGLPPPASTDTRPFPPAEDPLTTVLRPPGSSFAPFVLKLLPLLGLFFVVMLLLGSILFETLAPGRGVTGGVAVGAVSSLALISIPLSKAVKAARGTMVLVSPVGVELRDPHGFEVRLRWGNVIGVGSVDTRLTASSPLNGPGPRPRPARLSGQGLRGWGERVVSPRAPLWMRQHLAQQPRDPRTGLELLGLAFAAAGPEGPANPLLAQARHHRPDLFPADGAR